MQPTAQFNTARYDRSAALFSLLCIIHCLVLPLLVISMPFLAALAGTEWIHWALTIAAVFASASVIARDPSSRVWTFIGPAGIGVLLVSGALFAENFGFEETIPTLAGGLLLAGAHMARLLR